MAILQWTPVSSEKGRVDRLLKILISKRTGRELILKLDMLIRRLKCITFLRKSGSFYYMFVYLD